MNAEQVEDSDRDGNTSPPGEYWRWAQNEEMPFSAYGIPGPEWDVLTFAYTDGGEIAPSHLDMRTITITHGPDWGASKPGLESVGVEMRVAAWYTMRALTEYRGGPRAPEPMEQAIEEAFPYAVEVNPHETVTDPNEYRDEIHQTILAEVPLPDILAEVRRRAEEGGPDTEGDAGRDEPLIDARWTPRSSLPSPNMAGVKVVDSYDEEYVPDGVPDGDVIDALRIANGSVIKFNIDGEEKEIPVSGLSLNVDAESLQTMGTATSTASEAVKDLRDTLERVSEHINCRAIPPGVTRPRVRAPGGR